MDDFADPYARLKASEGMECLALLAFVAAVVCVIQKNLVLKNQRILFVVTGLLNLLAGEYVFCKNVKLNILHLSRHLFKNIKKEKNK